MSMRRLQELLLAARGDDYRSAVADRAAEIPGSDPDFCLEDVRRHEHQIVRIPDAGLKLRTHCAAVGLSWTEALEALGYWPPLGEEMTPRDELVAVCQRRELRVVHVDSERQTILIKWGGR
jgi:hypothetical protein